MTSGNGWSKWIITLAGILAAMGVAGSIGNAIGQGKMQTQQSTNTQDIRDQRSLTAQIPVIANDIENIKDDIKDIKDDMKENQKEILEAIEKK